jgi:hypothetical protein
VQTEHLGHGPTADKPYVSCTLRTPCTGEAASASGSNCFCIGK